MGLGCTGGQLPVPPPQWMPPVRGGDHARCTVAFLQGIGHLHVLCGVLILQFATTCRYVNIEMEN